MCASSRKAVFAHQQPCQAHPFSHFIALSPLETNAPPTPTDADCFALWDKYEMFDNVRRHSLSVAQVATALAKYARELGSDLDIQAVRASALLHDLAKSWCVKNGGSHALIGASWVRQETGNFKIAQGVALHVHWPWQMPRSAIATLPLLVLYADKRVRHDQIVSLEERFADLIVRYGKTESARAGIANSFEQARNLEATLSKQLNRDVHEDTFDCGRMVE